MPTSPPDDTLEAINDFGAAVAAVNDAMPDHELALRRLNAARRAGIEASSGLAVLTTRLVNVAHDTAGLSWKRIGDLLGVSKQRAISIANTPTETPKESTS